MGLKKEPKGVNLIVGPSVLTEQDRQMISNIIAQYKKTGEMPAKPITKRIGARRAKKIVSQG